MVWLSHWWNTSCLPRDPLNFPVMKLLSACAIKLRFRSLKKIVSYDRCRGEDLRIRTPANPVRNSSCSDRWNKSTPHFIWFLKNVDGPRQNLWRYPRKLVTNVNFSSDLSVRHRFFLEPSPDFAHSSQILLNASSDPPRWVLEIRGPIEVESRSQRGINIDSTGVQSAESVQKCRKGIKVYKSAECV